MAKSLGIRARNLCLYLELPDFMGLLNLGKVPFRSDKSELHVEKAEKREEQGSVRTFRNIFRLIFR